MPDGPAGLTEPTTAAGPTGPDGWDIEGTAEYLRGYLRRSDEATERGLERLIDAALARQQDASDINVLLLSLAIDRHALAMAGEPIHDGGTCTTDCAGDIRARYAQERDR